MMFISVKGVHSIDLVEFYLSVSFSDFGPVGGRIHTSFARKTWFCGSISIFGGDVEV